MSLKASNPPEIPGHGSLGFSFLIVTGIRHGDQSTISHGDEFKNLSGKGEISPDSTA